MKENYTSENIRSFGLKIIVWIILITVIIGIISQNIMIPLGGVIFGFAIEIIIVVLTWAST